jgi:FHA domain
MTDSMEATRRPLRAPIPRAQMPRPPMRRRSRRRWTVAAGVAAGWLVLWMATGSLLAATVMLLVLALIGGGLVAGLRMLGVTRDHPWLQGLATRPWRDGQDVLRLALRHLPEVFVVTPSGALMAPVAVEIRMNPRDYDSLAERIDVELAACSAADVYAEQVTAHQARFAGYGPAEVTLLSDPAVPAGRYQLRQGQPLGAGPRPGFDTAPPGAGYDTAPPRAGRAPVSPPPAPSYPAPPRPGTGSEPAGLFQARPPHSPAAGGLAESPDGGWPFGHDSATTAAPATAAAGLGLPTVAEPARPVIPPLRLITGGSVAQTRTSGARAGRGAVELALPDVPTVSREHARFTYSDGQWWIANLGLNGLMLNGSSLAGEHPLSDGDSIRWGRNQDAPVSRVEIG